jgi:hypothetical protein
VDKWGLFVIKNNGNVGIGTTGPQSQLHVTSDSATPYDTGISIEIPGVRTRRVVIGPPNSGGNGFRILRVAN